MIFKRILTLVLNSGSSSVKYQLYDMPEEVCLAKGALQKIGKSDSFLVRQLQGGRKVSFKTKIKNHQAAIKLVVQNLSNYLEKDSSASGAINVIGHRVVHGGEKFKSSVLIDNRVINAIRQYSKLAPLHNSANLAGISACKRILPDLPQIAVFDTAFHQSMPERAFLYGLPYTLYTRYAIRRYGFHGSSHRYVANQASKILHKNIKSLKIISCHLGNGCSITAIDRGKSIDTSMGFTPLEGLLMGTRCGDIDPAAVLYLMQKKQLTIKQTAEFLNKRCGLLGLSGKSNDMRDVLKLAQAGNRRANIALDVFTYRIKKYIGAYIAAMDGCDILVFTAGIGENASLIRRKTCRQLATVIKKFNIKVLTVSTNEELIIARDAYHLLLKSYNKIQ